MSSLGRSGGTRDPTPKGLGSETGREGEKVRRERARGREREKREGGSVGGGSGEVGGEEGVVGSPCLAQ